MSESSSEEDLGDLGDRDDRGDGGERTADALRTAVERTLAATAGSAVGTRERARGLFDEVARRGEAARGEIGRRGEAAREGVSRTRDAAREQVVRGREAARSDLVRRGEEASGRLAELLSELKLADRDDLGPLAERLAGIEARLAELERGLRGERLGEAGSKGESNPKVEGESTPSEADSGD